MCVCVHANESQMITSVYFGDISRAILRKVFHLASQCSSANFNAFGFSQCRAQPKGREGKAAFILLIAGNTVQRNTTKNMNVSAQAFLPLF